MTAEDQPWLEADRRPDGVDDATVEAVGKVTEALEWIERARGRLYDFHQMMGHADLLMGEAADALADAGHDDLARTLRVDLVGRNVLEGRWTFQTVEEFDATSLQVARDLEGRARGLTGGTRHVLESEMKERRRSAGRRHHEQRPDPGA